jgi:hypothetical protein
MLSACWLFLRCQRHFRSRRRLRRAAWVHPLRVSRREGGHNYFDQSVEWRVKNFRHIILTRSLFLAWLWRCQTPRQRRFRTQSVSTTVNLCLPNVNERRREATHTGTAQVKSNKYTCGFCQAFQRRCCGRGGQALPFTLNSAAVVPASGAGGGLSPGTLLASAPVMARRR